MSCHVCHDAPAEIIQMRKEAVPVHVCQACADSYAPLPQRILSGLRKLEQEIQSESRIEPMLHRNAAGVAAAIKLVQREMLRG